jgi:TolB-like protein
LENLKSNRSGDSSSHAERTQTVPSSQAIRKQLEKILLSRTFRGSEGQRNLLRFAVEQTLDGHPDLLKEYSIGVQALDRGEAFDPRADPIVRTQANKLRARLLKYYADEGLTDPVKIELPKGHYAPAFSAVASPSPARVTPAWLSLHARNAAILLFLLAATGTAAYFRGAARRDSLSSFRMHSVAVMPFQPIGGDKQDELFSDGLSEDLVTDLARTHNLRVVARRSTDQFKNRTVDIRTVGRTLNVGTVLEGRVRKSGDRLRVTAQLIDAASGYNLWSESYDRDLHDPLELQLEISRAITAALGRSFGREPGRDRSGTQSATPAPLSNQARP